MIKNSFSNVEEYANQEIDLVIMCVQDIDQNTEKQIKKINLSKDTYIYDINMQEIHLVQLRHWDWSLKSYFQWFKACLSSKQQNHTGCLIIHLRLNT